MPGDSLKDDQIRLGLDEFVAITRLLINKGVKIKKLRDIIYMENARYIAKKMK